MAEKKFTVLELLELDLKGHDALYLKCLAGRRGLTRPLTVPDVNRPGLALSGFYEAFAFQRIQVFGRGEAYYLDKLRQENKPENVKKIFSYQMPCCVFTSNLEPPKGFLEFAEESNCPVLQTDLVSSDFSQRFYRVVSSIFAPRKTMHGVLVDVYGIGMFLCGHSGVGKSEAALELVERGHRLVADDIVELRCVNGNTIIGQGANTQISHHMEIRGLGIINVTQMYGIGAVRLQKEVQLVVNLEEWDSAKVYDRIGIDQQNMELFGVKVPLLEIPVKPGRNLPIILEAAAKNERLKRMGYFSAKNFNQNILKWIETGEAQNVYYDGEDSY